MSYDCICQSTKTIVFFYLLKTGEMEVRNPLFAEPDPSTADSHLTTNNHYPQATTSPSSSPPKEKSLS